MVELKIVIGNKDGKSYQKNLDAQHVSNLIGRKLGEKIKGDIIGFTDYEFLISGGSNDCGFAMRKEIDGSSRKKILTLGSVGVKRKGKGIYLRRSIAGNTISERTTQVNLKLLKEGKKKLEEIFPKKETKEEDKSIENEKKD